MRFQNRREAGRALAVRLRKRQRAQELPGAVVLALPRGGLPVADEIARALAAPLDVLIVRKIGHPDRPEYGLGAVAGDAPPLYDPAALAAEGFTEQDLAAQAERERRELRRREEVYRQGRPSPQLAGHWAIVADDGLATGSTARAALHAARAWGPAHLTLAVPVCAPEGVRAVQGVADDIECIQEPALFGAVGYWYEHFDQLTDDDVLEILRSR